MHCRLCYNFLHLTSSICVTEHHAQNLSPSTSLFALWFVLSVFLPFILFYFCFGSFILWLSIIGAQVVPWICHVQQQAAGAVCVATSHFHEPLMFVCKVSHHPELPTDPLHSGSVICAELSGPKLVQCGPDLQFLFLWSQIVYSNWECNHGCHGPLGGLSLSCSSHTDSQFMRTCFSRQINSCVILFPFYYNWRHCTTNDIQGPRNVPASFPTGIFSINLSQICLVFLCLVVSFLRGSWSTFNLLCSSKNNWLQQ